ncbi:MAG: hypothetical protein HYX92_14830 [Chloroflexi bacterium]|nr:hypothetical protein [Chloroflexota bacterium]
MAETTFILRLLVYFVAAVFSLAALAAGFMLLQALAQRLKQRASRSRSAVMTEAPRDTPPPPAAPGAPSAGAPEGRPVLPTSPLDWPVLKITTLTTAPGTSRGQINRSGYLYVIGGRGVAEAKVSHN